MVASAFLWVAIAAWIAVLAGMLRGWARIAATLVGLGGGDPSRRGLPPLARLDGRGGKS